MRVRTDKHFKNGYIKFTIKQHSVTIRPKSHYEHPKRQSGQYWQNGHVNIEILPFGITIQST